MKMKKKLTAIIMAAVMTLSFSFVVLATENAEKDVGAEIGISTNSIGPNDLPSSGCRGGKLGGGGLGGSPNGGFHPLDP